MSTECVNWSCVKGDSAMISKIPQWIFDKYIFMPIINIENKQAVVVSKEITEEFSRNILMYYDSMPDVLYSNEEELLFHLKTLIKESIISKNINIERNESSFEEKLVKNHRYPIKEIYELYIRRAIDLNASDIHFEPCEENTNIRFRVDGRLINIKPISKEIYKFIITAIKINSSMNISNKFIPHDGKSTIVYKGTKYDLRISTIPVLNGEKTVIRILNSNKIKLQLSSLGFGNDALDVIRNLIQREQGLVLICGPTGSGKTTTLYSIINEIDAKKNNIMTIEDPVEYKLAGVNQVNLNEKVGLDFANGLRSILRQDPDVILIGEIRDEETAKIAIRASITGHLVLSTIHTNDTVSTISRLVNMGIEKHIVVDAISGIVCQRLESKLCEECREKTLFEDDEIISKGIVDGYRKGGCYKCVNGYKGRSLIYELMVMDSKARKLIMNSESLMDDDIKDELNRISFRDKIIEGIRKGEVDMVTYRKYSMWSKVNERV